MRDAPALHLEASQRGAAEPGHEEIVAPVRIAGAFVEMDPAGRDGGVPVHDGGLHSFVCGPGDTRLEAVRDHGPAVVVAGLQDIQLVAAHRPVLGLPEEAAHGIDREALGIAMAVGPDRRHGAGASHERVVGRHASVVVDTVHLAQRAGEVLGGVLLPAVADREEQLAVAIEEEAGAVVVVRSPEEPGRGRVDRLLVDPAALADSPADDRGHRRVAGSRFRVRKVDPAVLGVAGMDFDVEEAAVLLAPDLRRAHDRIGKQVALLHDPQPARPLRDEHAPVGQEGEAPGCLEVARHDLELERLLLGTDHRAVGIDDRRRMLLGFRFLLPDQDHETPDLLLREHGLEGGHGRALPAFANGLGDLRVVAAELPGSVDQAARGSAFEVAPVAGHAVLVVHGPRLCDRVVRPAPGAGIAWRALLGPGREGKGGGGDGPHSDGSRIHGHWERRIMPPAVRLSLGNQMVQTGADWCRVMRCHALGRRSDRASAFRHAPRAGLEPWPRCERRARGEPSHHRARRIRSRGSRGREATVSGPGR